VSKNPFSLLEHCYLALKVWGQTAVYITQLLIPTHAHFHWLKFIKNI